MEAVMARAYDEAKALLQRNRGALDEIIRRLTTAEAGSDTEFFAGNTLDGETVRQIVQRLGDKGDLATRDAEKAVFL